MLNKSSPFSALVKTIPNIDKMLLMLKRSAIAILLLIAGLCRVWAQTHDVDSLTKAWQKNKQDTTLVQLLIKKAGEVFIYSDPDAGMASLKQSLALSRKIHYQDGEVRSLATMASYISRAGDLPGSLKMTFDILPKAIAINDKFIIAQCYLTLGLDYSVLKDSKKALAYCIMANRITVNEHFTIFITASYNNIAKEYLEIKQADSAQYFTDKGYKFAIKNKDANIRYLMRNFGGIQVIKGNYSRALEYFLISIHDIPKMDDHYLLSEDYRRIAEVYQKLSRTDSCMWFAKKAFDEAKLAKNPELLMKSGVGGLIQPFFTTKPTGEGTGLGLSLSYDIVVNGHGGTLAVETKEGDHTEFIVTLPLI